VWSVTHSFGLHLLFLPAYQICDVTAEKLTLERLKESRRVLKKIICHLVSLVGIFQAFGKKAIWIHQNGLPSIYLYLFFYNCPVWNIEFHELDFLPRLNWIFLPSVACKIQVWNILINQVHQTLYFKEKNQVQIDKELA
jgi:hypothetical protein